MRILGVAASLSVCVLVACGAWYESLTAGDGPGRSVDLTPLVPILTAVFALALVWFGAAVAWIARVAARSRQTQRDAS